MLIHRYGKVNLTLTDFGMDDVRCNGTETDFEKCPHSRAINCNENEGAGVSCKGKYNILLVDSIIRYNCFD